MTTTFWHIEEKAKVEPSMRELLFPSSEGLNSGERLAELTSWLVALLLQVESGIPHNPRNVTRAVCGCKVDILLTRVCRKKSFDK